MNVQPSPPSLLHQYLEAQARLTPDKTALITAAVRISYRELDLQADALAEALRAHGVGLQDRVAILADNCAETVIAFYGSLKCGAVAVPLSGLLKHNKLVRILQDSGARILITQTRKKRIVEEALKLKELPRLIWIGPIEEMPWNLSATGISWSSLVPPYGEARMEDPKTEIEKRKADDGVGEAETGKQMPDYGGEPSELEHPEQRVIIDQDLAALIYTSGSTGEPKGIMAPHCAMLAAARSILKYLEMSSDDVVLNALPLSFDYGLYQSIMSVMVGGTLILEESFLYPVRVMEWIEKERVTALPVVPTMVSFLKRLRNPHRFDLSSIRFVSNTADAMSRSHLRFLQDLLPQARIFLMYGLSECKRVSYLPPEQIDIRPSSVGRPMSNCRVRVVDENGCDVSPGQSGELLVTGSNVMRGYWNAPELTAEVFRRDRATGRVWLHTGDLFARDVEGYLYFVSRRDDLIKTRGERVSPREIENVIRTLDFVQDAVVLGVQDELLGQAVAAAVCLKDPRQGSEKLIRSHCSSHLEAFMVPRHVLILDRWPITAHGKADRQRIRQQVESSSRPGLRHGSK